MGAACLAAQFGGVLGFAGTDDGDVIATRSIAIDLPIEPDQERRRHRIAEQIGRSGEHRAHVGADRL